jgi:hypothetical protein
MLLLFPPGPGLHCSLVLREPFTRKNRNTGHPPGGWNHNGVLYPSLPAEERIGQTPSTTLLLM